MDSKRCTICKTLKPISAFSFKSKKRNLLASECKSCHSNLSKKRYKKNPSLDKARIEEKRAAVKEWFYDQKKSLKCIKCGEDFPPALHFHHTDPETKVKGVTRLVSDAAPKEKILAEMAKCVVLCANCHVKVELGFIIL